MIFNRFRIWVAGRVVFLGATLALFVFLLMHPNLLMTTVMVGLIAVYQVYALLREVEKTNRSLADFFESIRYSDFSRTFRRTGDGSFDELYAEFNRVIEDFRRERKEKEQSRRYLETVVQHVGIGLISFQADGAVEFINTAAKRLLGVTSLNSVRLLEPVSPVLVDTLLRIRAGEKKLVKIGEKHEVQQLSLYATEFTLGKQQYTLVSFHNIQDELEEQEMKSWQNLIRVLTHEIMNSVTPIASLASTVSGLLKESEYAGDDNESRRAMTETSEDIRSAVETIRKRSEGLLHFVENYRTLTRIPRPDFSIISVSDLFNRILRLMECRFAESGIELRTTVVPEHLELTADPILVEQVLINLLMNAVEAVGNRPVSRIELRGITDSRDRVMIQVADNGPGIVADVIEKVFIPFFTTKPEGSGIGLSLSRQIMRAHGGSITVHSEPDRETVFTLIF